MLDEIDYGMLLLTGEGQVVHANPVARADLGASHPLELDGRQLRASQPQDAAALADALHAASRRGLRKLLTLGEGAQRVNMSVVPLGSASDPGGPVTLVMLGKSRVHETLSVQGYGRSHGLTLAETRVLAALCRDIPPSEIASQVGVEISTVRGQIGLIRQKTGAPSIRALVQQVAVLPPLMAVLRGLASGASDSDNDSQLEEPRRA